MHHEFKIKVYPGDTDTYGVVWHGAYIKWLEAGRIEVLEKLGIMFKELDEMGILMPVVELSINYKKFCRSYDELLITTKIEEYGTLDVVFYQEIKNLTTDKLALTARVKGVTTSAEGKLFRVLPEYVSSKIKL